MWRLTAFACRRRGAVEFHVHVEDVVKDHAFEEHDIEQEEDREDVAEDGFPRSPLDTSVLTHYIHHVTYAIWKSRVSEKL